MKTFKQYYRGYKLLKLITNFVFFFFLMAIFILVMLFEGVLDLYNFILSMVFSVFFQILISLFGFDYKDENIFEEYEGYVEEYKKQQLFKKKLQERLKE